MPQCSRPQRPSPLPDQLEIELAPGAQGNIQTLEVMKEVARYRSRSPLVRQTALGIIYPVPQNDSVGEALAIGQWVRSQMRYTGDTADEEQLTDPLTLLDQIERGVPCTSSDCDDMSLLTVTLLLSVGFTEVFYRAIRYDSEARPQDSFDHVYTVVYVADPITRTKIRLPLDCILPHVPMGSEVSHATGLEYAV
jgi:hypothetical protein